MQPRYQQVKNYVTGQIASGQWGHGQRLPSENELVRELALSRMTVHRALRELTEAGLLDRVPGVGTFVSRPQLNRPAMPLRDIGEDLQHRGQVHSCQLIVHQRIAADGAMAQLFQRGVASQLFHLTALHQADGVPVMLEDRWVNPAVAPNFLQLDVRHTTTTRYLLEVAPLQKLQQQIDAIRVTPQAARHLHIGMNHPVLLVRRRTWALDQVASYAQLYFVGGRYPLHESADQWPQLPACFERETSYE